MLPGSGMRSLPPLVGPNAICALKQELKSPGISFSSASIPWRRKHLFPTGTGWRRKGEKRMTSFLERADGPVFYTITLHRKLISGRLNPIWLLS